MNRRQWMQASGQTAALWMLAQSVGSPLLAQAKPAGKKPLDELLESLSQCETKALLCIKHCQKDLATGNKAMAECLQTVLEVQAACKALGDLAAFESAFAKDYAKLTAKVCQACAKVCEKHEKHSEICRECKEACLHCEKACLAFAA